MFQACFVVSYFKHKKADGSHKPAWAMQEVSAIAELGLINGRSNGNFEPNGNATRAKAIVFVLRLLDYKEGK